MTDDDEIDERAELRAAQQRLLEADTALGEALAAQQRGQKLVESIEGRLHQLNQTERVAKEGYEMSLATSLTSGQIPGYNLPERPARRDGERTQLQHELEACVGAQGHLNRALTDAQEIAVQHLRDLHSQAEAVLVSAADALAADIAALEAEAREMRCALRSLADTWPPVPEGVARHPLPCSSSVRILLSNPPANTRYNSDPKMKEAWSAFYNRLVETADAEPPA